MDPESKVSPPQLRTKEEQTTHNTLPSNLRSPIRILLFEMAARSRTPQQILDK